ncbi:hypothetical protein E2C01_027016 [Portunus trituberculatus]|uniref:Uncharacterized protein n=1 Tax=Portunus trituberculatus TaxID=210409 RepID=A0A5B7EGU3_PORTR|nr:hypothetical protein [Portunus trituberculatus]
MRCLGLVNRSWSSPEHDTTMILDHCLQEFLRARLSLLTTNTVQRRPRGSAGTVGPCQPARSRKGRLRGVILATTAG